jgi:hypothetical protein
MENVSHGAKANHKQTELGLGLQISIFSQRSFGGWKAEPSQEQLERYSFIFDFDAQSDHVKRGTRAKFVHAHLILSGCEDGCRASVLCGGIKLLDVDRGVSMMIRESDAVCDANAR